MLRSLNPFTLEVIARYEQENSRVLEKNIEQAHKSFLVWRKSPLNKRSELMTNLAKVLRENSMDYAQLMASEMGKPIRQGLAEIEKCAWACEYYASEAPSLLQPRVVETDAELSYVSHEPFGVWLAIMPWNYPFWQVIRCAVPAIMAGNSVVLKHASNVMGCALALETAFIAAGARKGIFKTLLISSSQVNDVIAHPLVKGVSLTGSEHAGRQVAASAGRNIKPCILELGGNNAFIVLADADIKKAATEAVIGRFQNSGQSCIAAKRFLIEASVYDEFMDLFLSKVRALKSGDPTAEDTYIGPLAKTDSAEEVHRQVMASIAKGAKVLTGGTYKDALYQPTVLVNCQPGMPVMDEEVFGPVASVMKIKDPGEAIEVSNQSRFGLGVSIYTSSIDKIKLSVSAFDEGSVFINSIVKSDPRLPFGGVKASGYGRELSVEGILEFMNCKTVFINS